MNINDLPPELFDLILEKIYHPHVTLVNNLFCYIYDINISHCISSDIVHNICHNNNRSLILYYFSYKYGTVLHTELSDYIDLHCIKNNYFHTLKWIVTNKYCSIDCVIYRAIAFSKLKMLKWLYHTKLVNIDEYDIRFAIMLNSKNIVRWMISINII